MTAENPIAAKNGTEMTFDEESETVRNHTPSVFYTEGIKFLISLLAVLTLFIYHRNGIALELSDVLLLGLAIMPWFSAFVGSFKLGKDGFEIEYLKKEVNKLKTEVKTEVKPLAERANKTANAAKDAAIGGVGGKMPAAENIGAAKMADGGNDADDPQKGHWGGSSISNGRRLSARVEKIPGENFFRRIIMRVESTNPKDNPLTGSILFHLHPTFTPTDFSVPVADGVAETSRVAYGAFTFGAEADEGKTRLEFDLMNLDDGDPFFTR